ncbi:hypothetical protein WN944_020089 [Citrus x changshan-huyou]|uniref:Uncharacterized protein n=1 Tax=Citrus x changshan-huyou TaxID=2935761 RepID=A0AAP0M2U6_9ROSI
MPPGRQITRATATRQSHLRQSLATSVQLTPAYRVHNCCRTTSMVPHLWLAINCLFTRPELRNQSQPSITITGPTSTQKWTVVNANPQLFSPTLTCSPLIRKDSRLQRVSSF